jgi:hypothetical protein
MFSGLMHPLLLPFSTVSVTFLMLSHISLDGSPESALRWIGSLKDNYVLVLDNLELLSKAELAKYFPPELRGNILITSCNYTTLDVKYEIL